MRDLVQEAKDVVDAEKQAEKDAARIRRHIAKPAVYIPRFFTLTPEKRAYMKRFGSRPANKRRSPLVLAQNVAESETGIRSQ